MVSETEFKAIFNDHKTLVFNLALNYVQNTEDAQDITQEVFVKVYQNYEAFNPEAAAIKTWIYRITVNQCLDFIKARKSKKRFGFLVSLFRPESGEPAFEMPAFDHPGVALENKEALRHLFAHINQLPDNQKTALILSKIEDRSQKEVAEIMQLSPKAVESLIQRAKISLSAKLVGRSKT